MLNRSTPIDETSLRGLHPRSIEDPQQVRSLLERARASGSVFHRGLNASVDLETAQLEEIAGDVLVLRASTFQRSINGQVFLNFSCEGRAYFFETRRAAPYQGDRLEVRLPGTIYCTERRDRSRRTPDRESGDPRRVEIEGAAGGRLEGWVEDISPGGLGIVVAGDAPVDGAAPLRVRFLDGCEGGTETRLQVRNRGPVDGRRGWTRIGLVRGRSFDVPLIEVEHREAILAEPAADAQLPGPRTQAVEDQFESLQVLRIPNQRGEEIVALLDAWGEVRGAPAVIIPTGWGRTKEALLPLARTIVATFRAHGQPVSVLRFDGIRKRGESHNDPECSVPGRENHHFVFSQGVDDIATVAAFVKQSERFEASSVVLVSFSAAAVQARKAVALDRAARIDGWISVVGSPDIQSMTRSISGGIDFVLGHERGLRFGLQELLGVAVDIDEIAVDGEKNGLLFIEDSRRDFEAIGIPITWYHGRYDAWVDLARVRDVLSRGDTSQRRLLEIPTGHQLKSSSQATAAFQLIAREVARMALGRELAPVAASARDVRSRRLAEHARRPAIDTDLHGFWRDYLVGRDRSVGIELLTSGSAYREMMTMQIAALELGQSGAVLDLGSGIGAFELQLARTGCRLDGLRVTSIDYVRDAMQRARMRLAAESTASALAVDFLEADLDVIHSDRTIPLRSERYDAVLASLLLSYLERPDLVLAEAHRLLRPGGRLVISSLRRDADISRLYVESFAELQIGVAGRDLPELERVRLDTVARNFLNDAAKILDLEEAGAFHFWDAGELACLVEAAGFTRVKTWAALGSPSQATVLAALRR